MSIRRQVCKVMGRVVPTALVLSVLITGCGPTSSQEQSSQQIPTPAATVAEPISLMPSPTPVSTPETSSAPTVQVTPVPTTSAANFDPNGIVAVVNGEKITNKEFYQELEKRYGQDLISDMVITKLIEQEARKRGVSVSNDDMQKALQQLQTAFPGQSIEEIAQGQNMTGDQLREQVRVMALLDKMLAPQVKVTEQDARNFYNQNPQVFQSQEQLRLGQVVTDNEQQAADAAQALRDGKDLKEVIAKYGSKSPERAKKNGDLGYKSLNELDPQLGMTVMQMAVGDVSDPIRLPDGSYAVVKMIDRKGGVQMPFDQVKDRAMELAKQDKINSMIPKFLEELYSKAKIQSRIKIIPPNTQQPSAEPSQPSPSPPAPSGEETKG